MTSKPSPTTRSTCRSGRTTRPAAFNKKSNPGQPANGTADRQKLLERLRRMAELIRQASERDPQAFRRHVRLDPATDRPFGNLVQSWQEADFAALDAAWCGVAGVAPRVACRETASGLFNPQSYRRAYIERPRGHSKTGDMAVQIAWALLFSPRPLRGIAAAADREQAGLIADALKTLCRANPGVCDDLRFRQNAVENPATGGRLDLISSDVDSSYGLTPDFVICDELCHWPREGLWHSLASSAAKKPHCLLAVLTNAGVGRGWQWRVREAARSRDDWYFSSLAGSQAPWVRPADLAEQKALLPPGVFDRLWNNAWQDAEGDFLTAAEVSACRDESLAEQRHGRPGVRYVAAVDYAEKHDLTAGVILHREAAAPGAEGRLVVDRLDVAVPRPDAPTLVSWVEDWMIRTAAAFPAVTFVLDEYQLLGSIQRLSPRLKVVRFPFAAGKGNHDLALTLRRLVLHRGIAWPRGCGARPDDPADDLEAELAALRTRQHESGRVRFDHPPGGHDDRAFAVAAAAWLASSAGGPTVWNVASGREGFAAW